MDSTYCPSCAGPTELWLMKPGEPPRSVCSKCGKVHYTGPRLVAGAVAGDVTARDEIVEVRLVRPEEVPWGSSPSRRRGARSRTSSPGAEEVYF